MNLKMPTLAFFLFAALGEISGCYAFWAWVRLEKSILWVVPGILALISFALSLTQVNASNAGRVYAAYGRYLHSGISGLVMAD
jgi:small multidrug resistance family-3 protein